MRGRWWAVTAVVILLICACAPPKSVATAVSPSPSPSPTATAPLQASSPPFHAGEVGVAYAPVALAATGGLAPYTWSVSSGALPGGLALGSDGSVSGSPASPGTFTFTIQVADAGDSTASLPGAISIAAPLSAALVTGCAKYCAVELGCVSVCGQFGQLSGGVGPYGYALTQGPLPAGTSLSGLSLTGTFTGLSGYLKFTVQVTDALGASTTIAPTFWMYQHISVASGACYGNYGTGCSVSLPISGGVPGSSLSVQLLSQAQNTNPNPNGGACWQPAQTAPPAGYTLTVSGGYVVVTIPRRILPGYGAVWTVVVNDQSLCAASTYCTSPLATVVIGVQCG